MANVKIPLNVRNLETRKKAIENWKISQQDKKDLLKFLDDLSLGKINKGKKISENRQLKYLDILKTPLQFFNKPTSQLTIKNMDKFEKDLSSNKIKSYKNKPFEFSTKADIRRLLKIYLKWKIGDNNKFRKLCEWFDTRVPKKTPDYLTEQEIIKLYKGCKNSEERFLIAVLFDSGARAEEFHNLRYEDICTPKDKDNYVKITLKEEYSKTKGRTISLYWKHSLEVIRDYLKERELEGIKSNEPIFKLSYDNARQFLTRLGKRILNKNIHYHLFRHSSATYYAPKLNRQELCYRYGWAFSSRMPDVYISRAGMESKELDEKFRATELEELEKRIEKERFEREKGFEKMKKGFRFTLELIKDIANNQHLNPKYAIKDNKTGEILTEEQALIKICEKLEKIGKEFSN